MRLVPFLTLLLAMTAVEASAQRHALPTRNETAHTVLRRWAGRPLPTWNARHAKVSAPRIALAKLWFRRDVEAVNTYLKRAEPWSNVGSTWLGHHGDYDFTLVTLVTMLHALRDHPDRLAPATRAHMLDRLFPVTGGTPSVQVPNSLGFVRDTENHILMTESSRYLTNQWLHAHGRDEPAYDNAKNGLGAWMVDYLQQLRAEGFHEFNSIPYEGYTLHALSNLAAFAEPAAVRDAARRLLDDVAWRYALGSLNGRRCVPFRRQLRRAGERSLSADALGAFMTVWLDDPWRRVAPGKGAPNAHAMVVAAAAPHDVPGAAARWAKRKRRDYYVRIGHGDFSSPEIFSGGPGYLISAGGSFRGVLARVVPRPTVLLLNDGAQTINECFHLPGRSNVARWNNTGVHNRLAVGPAPVRVPENASPVAQHDKWRVFEPAAERAPRIAVYNEARFGLLLVLQRNGAPEAQLDALRQANPDRAALRRRFHWPGGRSVTYEVSAPRDRWVIRKVNGAAVSRTFDRWPRWGKQRETVTEALKSE